VASALRDGLIHPRHAAIIARTIDGLPADVQATMDRQIEGDLVEEAKRFAPYQLAKIAERLRYLYDQDGTLTDDADRSRRRRLDYRRHPDGSMTGEFHLDPPTAELFETVLDSQLADLTADQRSTRTPAQLRHDALRDLMTMLLRTAALPTTAGVTTTVVVTVTLRQWTALLALAGIAGDRDCKTTTDAQPRTADST
jgi:hypothetical protein